MGINVAILGILGSAMTLITGKGRSNTLSDVTVQAACVVALYCWYGVKLNVPLPTLLGALACLAAILFTYRMVRDGLATVIADSQLASLFSKRAVVFGLFYALAYVFMTPPGSSSQLPIVVGNHDILNYINVGDYLQRLGPSNIAGIRLASSLSYEATPAVYPALQATAALLDGDIMRAALPTMLGVVALTGFAIASITQAAFALSRSTTYALAAIVISGPLFRYTSANFFLSQIMGSLVLLLFLGKTIEFLRLSSPKSWTAIAVSFAPHYILIFYLYPVFLVIAAGLQTMLVAGSYYLPAALGGDHAHESGRTKTIVQWGAGVVTCIVVVAAVDPMHFQQLASWVLFLSNVKEVGWPMSFISPAAIMGLPGDLQVTTRAAQVASTIAFLVVTFVIAYLYLVRGIGRTSVTGGVLFLLAGFSFAIYAAYFYLTGTSYQQWKLATYLPLLMSFAWWAPWIRVIRTKVKSKMVVALATQLLCALLIIGNLLSYALRELPMRTFSASYANLRALDMMGAWTELYVRMSSYASTFFPVYFVRHKTLHLLSESYYPREQIALANVSPTQPLFVEGDACTSETAGSTTVVGVGCLYLHPSTMEFGTAYQFSRQLPIGIEAEGLSHRESWGRWSDGYKVAFRLFASNADLSKEPRGFVNFDIHPYVGRHAVQRVLITWGERRTEEVIDRGRTMSVPYSREDWKGESIQAMTITMDLPDAIAPNAIDPNSGDLRKLAIGFAAIVVTNKPLGNVIGGNAQPAISPSQGARN